jgi:hypothetical protein
MKRIFVLSICVLPFFCFAQTDNDEQNNSMSTSSASPRKILIIPYEPKMHISDADHDIAENSNRSPQQMRAMFRQGLAHQVNATIVKQFPTYSLLEDLRPEAQRELQRIYHAIDYSYDTVFSVQQMKRDAWGKKLSKKEQKQRMEKQTGSEDLKFMNVKMLDPQLLEELSTVYSADLFVFVTQVEIKTNRKECAGSGVDLFDRDVKVHYAIYSKSGVEVFGGIATYNSTESTNDVTAIMQQNFPHISETILTALK